MHTELASALRVEWRPLAALDAVTDEWRSLAARALEPNVFYEPAFALAAAPVFGRDVGAALVWLRARLVGFFPARIARRRYGVPLPVLVGWTHPYAPLGTPLIAAEAAEEVLAVWLDHIASRRELPGLALLPLVPENGPFGAALDARLAGRQHASLGRHPRALLAPGAERGSYLEHAGSARKRKEWRRQRRRLDEKGAVAVASASDAGAALEEFFALEASGWKGRAGTAARDQPDIREFMRQAVADLGGNASIHRLLVDDRAIAAAITLRSRDHAWLWKIAYDEGWAPYSPGVLLVRELTEILLADDTLARVDSCATANHPMIDRLWAERLALADRLIRARAGAPFRLACGLEVLRRAGIAGAKAVRDRTRGR